jgi:hypothetical protein
MVTPFYRVLPHGAFRIDGWLCPGGGCWGETNSLTELQLRWSEGQESGVGVTTEFRGIAFLQAAS